MAASRARESSRASEPDLLRSVVQIDPRTVVPEPGPFANASGSPPRDQRSPVLCILSACPAPVAVEVSLPPEPRYDPSSRALWLGDFLLMRFLRRAKNQESILMAFEEEGQQNGGRWPRKIDDPISGASPDPVKRLHDTLGALNATIEKGAAQAAAPRSVKFATDGTGQAVCWRIVAG